MHVNPRQSLRPPQASTGRNGKRLNEYSVEELQRALHGVDIAIEDCREYPGTGTRMNGHDELNISFFLERREKVLAELATRT